MALPKKRPKSLAATASQVAKAEKRARESGLSPRSTKHPDYRGVLLKRGDLRVVIGAGGTVYRLQVLHPKKGWVNSLQARTPKALAAKCNPFLQPLRRCEIEELAEVTPTQAAELLDSPFLMRQANYALHWSKGEYAWTVATGGRFQAYQPWTVEAALGPAPVEMGLRVIVHPSREKVGLQVNVDGENWETVYWAASFASLRSKVGNAEVERNAQLAFSTFDELAANYRRWVSTGEAAALFDRLPNHQNDVALPDVEFPEFDWERV